MLESRNEAVMVVGGKPVMRFYSDSDAPVTYVTSGQTTTAYQKNRVVAQYKEPHA